ncbi:hypothetical protein P175DRAFT_0353523 [Aspergillus ochraceoroseus IBT 24754]|uniref:Uncharacterized protein n=1 Tax=Aspergillus ochraceoroseus IBT 24754 TaxID=1392256 RepID=A0A2T5LPI3_9EURO|nr:uncharacterized protein P175DRAFT_0353523 [Aspergillus ochraceoroseus IBT 24754]PTU18191.1 hypothetical protein P175DRAFT_0353523 [Aspergillus ochraceoroseus IBT 24754]
MERGSEMSIMTCVTYVSFVRPYVQATTTTTSESLSFSFSLSVSLSLTRSLPFYSDQKEKKKKKSPKRWPNITKEALSNSPRQQRGFRSRDWDFLPHRESRTREKKRRRRRRRRTTSIDLI